MRHFHTEHGIQTESWSPLARQRENLGIFGFELTDAEVDSISSLESGRLWGGDPETNEEF